MTRLPSLSLEQMNDAQRQVHKSITSGARGRLGGPFTPLLHSPELAHHVEQLGVYIRYNSQVPERQRELVICMIGAHWRADYEWHVHAPLAQKQGIPASALAQIANGKTADFKDAKDASTYAFARELLQTNRVSDSTYQSALDSLGSVGVVDLTGLIGYYTLLAMTLNTFHVAVPEPANIPWHHHS